MARSITRSAAGGTVPSGGPAWGSTLALTASLALFPTAGAAAQETVFADIDLAGWHRMGLATGSLEGGPAQLAPLFDGNPRSGLRAGDDTLELVLEFEEAQDVRSVRVTPGAGHAHAVRLVVVETDGGRFAAGEYVVAAGGQAVFRLLDVGCRRLELEVERIESEAPVTLAEVAVTSRQLIDAIALEDVPAALPEGGSFPVRVRGRDAYGGRPDITAQAQLAVTPARALALVRRGERDHAVMRVGGTITIAPHLGSLRGEARTCFVQPLKPPPPAPEARAGMGIIELELEGTPPFQVLRRAVGVIDAVVAGRAESRAFVDDGVLPGQAYQYSVRGVDRFDNPLTLLSAETRVRTLPAGSPGMVPVGRVPLLVALFPDSLGPGERDAVVESLEAARLFVWRHTRGRLLLDPTYLDLPGRTPVTAGPTMAGIEARLLQQGVPPGDAGLVYAVANDLAGSYGGFRLTGGAAGAMGRRADAPTPAGALGPDPEAAFAFVHELWHVVGLVFSGEGPGAAGLPLQPSGEFAEDVAARLLGHGAGRPFDAGESWDGHAALFAAFDAWERIGPPYRRPYEVLDSDGDGLPDDAPGLPADERRLGTDPHLADTDGDGLSDLDELAAGLYAGSNPRHPDTDGDGTSDGADRWPLSNFSGRIPHGEQPARLASLPDAARPDAEAVYLSACWNERGLQLEVATREPRDLFLELDGSGHLGRWESDVDTGTSDAPASDVWCGPARLALRAHAAPRGVFVGDRAVPGASLRAERRGDLMVVSVALPAALGPGAPDAGVVPGSPRSAGLLLRPGRVLGLGLTVRPTREDDERPFDPWVTDDEGRPAWTSLFETHRLLDAELRPAP